MEAIQIKGVTKRYKDVLALDNVSFTFEFGKIYFWNKSDTVKVPPR